MQFDSLSAVFEMQGHGAFVWSAYMIGFVVLTYLVMSPWRKSKRFFIEQSMRLRREQNQKVVDNPS